MYFKMLKVVFWKAKDTKWIIIMAAFVLATISVLFAVGESVESSFLEAVHSSSRYDMNIMDMEYEEATGYINSLQKEKMLSYSAITTEDFVLSVPDSYFYVSCIGIEGDYEEIYQLDIVEGGYPQNANEIVIDYKINQIFEQKYQIGDEVSFEIYSPSEKGYKTISYRISGFFYVSHSGEYDLYGFVSIEGGDKALSCGDEKKVYNILLKAKEDTKSSIEGLAERLASFGCEKIIINMARYEMLTEKESDSNGFIVAFKGLAIFVGFVSFALLFNMFHVTTVNKIQQIGVLRSIGMNKYQLAKVMLLSLLLYMMFSAVLGFVLFAVIERVFGNMLIKLFLDSFTRDLQYISVQWHFNTKAFMGCMMLILFIMLAAYANIMMKVMRLTPLQAVHYKGERSAGHVVGKRIGKKEKFISFLGRRNLSRNRLQTMYTAFTLGVMSVLFVTLMSIMGNVDLYDIDAMRKSNLYDYEFYEDVLVASIDEKMVNEIAALDTVEDICVARRSVYEFFQEEGAQVNSDTVVETRVYGEEVFERICKENNVKYTGEATYLLLSSDISPQNTCLLYDRDKKAHKIIIDANIEKDNYCETRPLGNAICLIMNEQAALELLGEYDYNVLLVNAEEKEECLKEVEEIFAKKNIKVYFDDLKVDTEDAREQLRSIVFIATYVLFCFVVMVVANIICNISINVNIRTKEYGILLAMGMNRKQIIRLMIYEIMYIMEKVLVFSAPCGILISTFFVSGLGQEIKILKLLIITVVSSLFLYLITYGICYLKGNRRFNDSILHLVWDE